MLMFDKQTNRHRGKSNFIYISSIYKSKMCTVIKYQIHICQTCADFRQFYFIMKYCAWLLPKGADDVVTAETRHRFPRAPSSS